MHPYLTRLGISPGVQAFFQPFYNTGDFGNLTFSYGDSIEHFGFAFHKIPVAGKLWIAGNLNFYMVRKVFICGSAMEAIAYMNYYPALSSRPDNILFVSTGIKPMTGHIDWINMHLVNKTIALIYGNDILGKICDLKIAAAIRKMPVIINYSDAVVTINFRNKIYEFNEQHFSLNTFEKACGYRFNIRTPKTIESTCFLDRLKAAAFPSP